MALVARGCGGQAPALANGVFEWCSIRFDNHSGELGLGRDPLPALENGNAVEGAARVLGLKGPDGGAILDYWVTLAMDARGERLDSIAWHARLRSDALWAQACQAAFDTRSSTRSVGTAAR